MKRILIFDLQYYPFVGGAEVAIKEITDRIPKEEIEFHLVTSRFDSTLPKEEQIGNVLVHRIGLATPHPGIEALGRFPLHLNKHLYQLLAAWKAHQLHVRYQYDLVWAMMAHSAGIPAGIFKTFHPEVPYLLTLQEGDPPEHIERLMRPVWPLFTAGFRRADELQAISTFLLAWGKRMGFKGEGMVIPNGVDIERFSKEFSEAELIAERAKLDKREGDVFLVTTSRLVRKNGVDTVIRALPLMPEQVSFLIYGIGPEEAALKALASELGVAPRVRFMGQVGHEALPRSLAACDIFIRPSRSEGMGNSFIEAMAAGLPVIATQEGGISDFLFDAKRNPDHEATGWAVDVDASDQCATAILDVLERPEAAERITRYAIQLVRERYNWDTVARDMNILFASRW